MVKTSIAIAAALVLLSGCAPRTANQEVSNDVQELRLKDYAPTSIFNIPVTEVPQAKYPVIDMHSHDYASTPGEVAAWVATLDACNIDLVNVMHCEWIGAPFDEMVERYGAYPDRFAIWCSLDYTDFDKEDWSERAIARLEELHSKGAVGIGEMVDKGLGDTYARPVSGLGIHIDDPKLQPVLKRAGELGMPVNIHLAEPIWMYEELNNHNDGLMNGANWKVDTTIEGCYDYNEIMAAFERAVAANPNTTFIACHYMNMTNDYPRLGALLDKYNNLYVDIGARIGESAVIPRASRRFIMKYADRVLYGTDNGMSPDMYRFTFRILETDDEHIYQPDFGYHWSYSGFYLPNDVLHKIYRDNALKIIKR
ncbi:MAG: amidohydrolase family protein [Tidjanibacter sp.]|nr:amidohydrolase family protein [Tidjanibacter sp.]